MGVATKFTTFSDILSAGKTPFALQAILKDLVNKRSRHILISEGVMYRSWDLKMCPY